MPEKKPLLKRFFSSKNPKLTLERAAHAVFQWTRVAREDGVPKAMKYLVAGHLHRN